MFQATLSDRLTVFFLKKGSLFAAGMYPSISLLNLSDLSYTGRFSSKRCRRIAFQVSL